MRQQLITTILLAIILSVAICIKMLYYPKLYGHTAFYFHSTFWICGILITIISFNLIWHWATARKSGQKPRPYAFWPNRRKTFRIIYPAFLRPIIIIDTANDVKRRQLEFSIVDLSQEGCCFLDDGSLGEMNVFTGRVQLNNGNTITVTGRFIRRKGDHISVRFERAIGWPTLLEEQRRVLVHMKPAPRHTA